MKYKLLAAKDYKLRKSGVVRKKKHVMPSVLVDVTDTETGEVVEGCELAKGQFVDCTPFVKLYRPNLLEQLSVSELKVMCYVMEKMNKYGVVEIDTMDREVYEYTGYRYSSEIRRGIKGLKDMSVLQEEKVTRNRWKVNPDCMEKRERQIPGESRARLFVKIYNPRPLMAMSGVALSVFYYICLKMDYEGCVKMNLEEFGKLAGYRRRVFGGGLSERVGREDNRRPNKLIRGRVSFYRGKKELLNLDVIREITTMVDDDTRKSIARGKWYRVNPNVFIKGNRLDLGYGIEGDEE